LFRVWVEPFRGPKIRAVAAGRRTVTSPYAATKGGVNALVRAAAVDLGRYGILVNAICPLSGMSANTSGMNFDTFPELHWRYGYPMVLLLMLGTSAALFRFFRRSDWL
jgi:NAD(P)-dependent dehydrogenase (short-subunit alcohol dehydrogenase family)